MGSGYGRVEGLKEVHVTEKFFLSSGVAFDDCTRDLCPYLYSEASAKNLKVQACAHPFLYPVAVFAKRS